MINETGHNEYYIKAEKNGIFATYYLIPHNSTGYYDRDEINLRDYKLNGLVSYNNKENSFNFKIGNKKVETNMLHVLGGQNTVFFVDKETKEYYVVKNKKVQGPFNDIASIKNDDREINFYVIDKNNEVQKLNSNTMELHDTGYAKVSQNVLKNLDGKYAYSEGGVPTTDFVFNSPNLIQKEAYRNEYMKFISDGSNTTVYNHDKPISVIKGIGNLVEEPEYYDNGLVALKSKDKSVIFDARDSKIIYETNEPFEKVYFDNGSEEAIVATFKNHSVYVGAKYDYKKLKNFTFKNEIPYKAEGIINNCIQVKNEQGKCGIVDPLNKQVLAFDYDDFGVKYYENYSERFIPIVKDGKMGLFDTKELAITVKPFCKNIILNNHDSGYVCENLYRFPFKGENGKLGIVNSKGHVVVEPVLEDTHFSSGGFYKEKTSFNCFRIKKDENKSESDYIYLSLKNPKLFPTTPQSHTSTSEKKVEVKKTHNKYSSDEIAFGTLVGLHAFGPLGAMVGYEHMSSQKVTSTSYETQKVKTSRDVMVQLPEYFLEYMHLDTADMPEKEVPEGFPIPEPLTIDEYIKNSESKKKIKMQDDSSMSM